MSIMTHTRIISNVILRQLIKTINAFKYDSTICTAVILMIMASLCVCDKIENSVKRDLTEDIRTKLHKEAIDDISGESIRQGLEYFANTTHFAGSEESIKQAAKVQSLFIQYGFDKAEIKKYNVLLSLPGIPGSVTIKDQSGTELFRTQVFEKILDPAENNSQVTPPYNGFSASGTVTGQLVYAYFGRSRDYEKLAEQGVNVTGKIVILRYGRGSRGTKIHRAQRLGAIGAILYSDPEDFAVMGTDKVYPEYNQLPRTAVARGSIKWNKGGGDLLTPSFPSIEGIYRRRLEDIQDSLPKIPVFPISYGDAQSLLSTLTGKLPRFYWKGGLPIDYGVQTDDTDTRTVTLTVNTQLLRKDIHNVIGYIRGHQEPDHLVIVGNHRDAWVYGGTDAVSGTAVMMEIARVFGTLLKKGWKPRRTIVFGSWDAEELGVIGSTEWVEEYANILKARAVAYINVDQAIDGNLTFSARTMPLLELIVTAAAKQVPTPLGNESVFDEWVRLTPSKNNSSLPHCQSKRSFTVRLFNCSMSLRFQRLAMDSDYAWFYNFVGVPSLDVRYTYDRKLLRDFGNPLYHTLHDTYRLLAALMDPTFKYHQATARVMGHVILSLADSSIIPFNISHYAQRIGNFRDLLVEKVGEVLKENHISLESLDVAISNFADAAQLFEEVIKHTSPSDLQNVFLINSRLVALEKAFLHTGDTPVVSQATGRRHCLLSLPKRGRRIRYFPGIEESVAKAKRGKGSWEDVKQQISIIVYSLMSARQLLDLTPI